MKWSAVILLTVVAAACKREAPPQPQPKTRVVTTTAAGKPVDFRNQKIDTPVALNANLAEAKGIGPKLGPDGNVSGEVTAFGPNDPIYLTIKFRESPGGLQASLRIEDAKGHE